MRSKNPETMKRILEFVESYYLEYNRSPATSAISEGVGIARGTVYKYLVDMAERGMIEYDGRTIMTEKIEKTRPRMIRAAVLGNIACGLSNLAEENIEEYVSLPESLFGKGEFYILRARGESMIDAGINNGDLVVIRKQDVAENGEIVVALVDGETTLKRFYKEDGRIRLHPENRKMEDIYTDNCFIQGVAVNVIRSLH